MDRRDNFEKEKKKATKMFHGMRACFSSTCMHVCSVSRCVFVCGKKRKDSVFRIYRKKFWYHKIEYFGGTNLLKQSLEVSS